jgi:hypothetical protein
MELEELLRKINLLNYKPEIDKILVDREDLLKLRDEIKTLRVHLSVAKDDRDTYKSKFHNCIAKHINTYKEIKDL